MASNPIPSSAMDKFRWASFAFKWILIVFAFACLFILFICS